MRSTIPGFQATEPTAKARSKATSVSLCRPNSNQCLCLALFTNTRQTPDGSRAIYASTLFSIIAFLAWIYDDTETVRRLFAFNIFQRFRRVEVTATVFPAGPGIHPIQHFATAALFFRHIKTISASGPTNKRLACPTLFPTAWILPRFPVCGM